jgi:hypothetical protein
MEALGDEPDRPLLEIKRDNAAPADGQFSVFAEPLDQALKEARETLDAEPASGADTDK